MITNQRQYLNTQAQAEATQYRGVAAERLQQVADALELRVREVFTLAELGPTGDSMRARRRRSSKHRSGV
jgi:hypothetical protein